jgi:hypothetical protein
MLEHILTDPWFWAFLAAIGWSIAFGVTGARFNLPKTVTLSGETFQATGVVGRVQLRHSTVWAWCHRAGRASLQSQR